jgi:hypothetical protein
VICLTSDVQILGIQNLDIEAHFHASEQVTESNSGPFNLID